jgi:O-antigen/teichoic acid export membrane protein
LYVPVLGIIANADAVAQFRVGMSFALVVALPLTVVEQITLPALAEMSQSGQHGRIIPFVNNAGRLAFGLSLLPGLVLLIVGDEIIAFLFGAAFAGAYPVMAVLVVGFLAVNWVGPSMQLLSATSFEREALVISGIGAGLTLALIVALVPQGGALGAALAFASSRLLRAVAFRWVGARRLAA